jgi:hypothetical protein
MVRLLSGSNLAHFLRARYTTLPRARCLGLVFVSTKRHPLNTDVICLFSSSPLCHIVHLPLLSASSLKIPPRYPNICNNLACLLLSSFHPGTSRRGTSSYPQTTPNPASIYSSFPSQVELISPNRRQILFLSSVSSGTREKWRFEYAI